jgi:hypothetical protein
MLLHRAARGRDLRVLAPHAPSRREPPAQDAAETGPTAGSVPPEPLTPAPDAAAPAVAPEAAERPTRGIARDEVLKLDTLHLLEEIEAEVRRSPVGSTIAAICRDLGISPSLCDGAFWNRLFDAIRLYRGSLPSLVLEVKRREQRFEQDEWKHKGLELPEEFRDGIRRVLGFLIGEPPVDPFAVAAAPGALAEMAAPVAPVVAAATGPP